MNNLIVEFMGHPVNLSNVKYYPGCDAILCGNPDNWEPSEPAEIYFKIDTGNKLLDDLLEMDYLVDIEVAAFEAIESNKKDQELDNAYNNYITIVG